MSKWTKGWRRIPAKRATHRWVIGTEDGTSVASCEPMGPWITPADADAIADMIAATPRLVEAMEELLRGNPVFRSKPVGAPGSPARLEQEAAIAAEDKARTALSAARGEG